MKKFNLKKALKGYPVITWDGVDVEKIVEFKGVGVYPVLYKLINVPLIYTCTQNGINDLNADKGSLDLFMKETKKVGWINLIKTEYGMKLSLNIYETKEAAKENALCDFQQVKIEYD